MTNTNRLAQAAQNWLATYAAGCSPDLRDEADITFEAAFRTFAPELFEVENEIDGLRPIRTFSRVRVTFLGSSGSVDVDKRGMVHFN